MQGQLRYKKAALNPLSDAEAIADLELKAIAVRRFMLELGARTGIRLHYGAIFSSVEILTLLYDRWMNVDPAAPGSETRDRFILSKGHAAPGLYAVLALDGFFSKAEFDLFRKIGGKLQGHPDRNKTPGVDCSTGSLGQGFPVGCGMALAAKADGAPWKVYSCVSDGECNEGSTWEAALIAGNLGLDRQIVLVDANGKSSYGPMKGRNSVDPLADKWRSFNWEVFECDGHDFVDLSRALDAAERVEGRPSVILCSTVKGKGIPWAESRNTKSNFKLEEGPCAEALAALAAREKEIRDARK
jgi:transketolase